MNPTHSICPHCRSEQIAEILYGYPSDEGEAAAKRGDIVLGGCCVSSQDPTHTCLKCGSGWATSDDLSESRISELFADYFANWDISLPKGAESAMARGSIHKAGWNIHYRFDVESERVMEFYATHRMTDDRRVRIYESGRREFLAAIQSGMVVGKEDEYKEHNRRVVEEVNRLGLYPKGDINAYLRTHDVPLAEDRGDDE